MTWLDRFLRDARIARARAFIPSGARVLDVGCGDGTLALEETNIREGHGIDPELTSPPSVRNWCWHRGSFPGELPLSVGAFDVILALAVLEHIPEGELAGFCAACARYLTPCGRLILTVPAGFVDHLLRWLKAARLIDGMELEQHHGLKAQDTAVLMRRAGLELLRHRRFELGLNHLFVFSKTA